MLIVHINGVPCDSSTHACSAFLYKLPIPPVLSCYHNRKQTKKSMYCLIFIDMKSRAEKQADQCLPTVKNIYLSQFIKRII